MWAGFIWLKASSCKENNEPYSPLEVWEYFHLLSKHKLPYNSPTSLELIQLQRTYCVVANNSQFSLSSTIDFIVSISGKDAENSLFLNSLCSRAICE
jgi:hypothetical protein